MLGSTLTTKVQITLPKVLWDALHLKTGDRVLFEELGEGTYIIKPRTIDVRSLKGSVSHQGSAKTLQEMEAAIAANIRKPS